MRLFSPIFNLYHRNYVILGCSALLHFLQIGRTEKDLFTVARLVGLTWGQLANLPTFRTAALEVNPNSSYQSQTAEIKFIRPFTLLTVRNQIYCTTALYCVHVDGWTSTRRTWRWCTARRGRVGPVSWSAPSFSTQGGKSRRRKFCSSTVPFGQQTARIQPLTFIASRGHYEA